MDTVIASEPLAARPLMAWLEAVRKDNILASATAAKGFFGLRRLSLSCINVSSMVLLAVSASLGNALL